MKSLDYFKIHRKNAVAKQAVKDAWIRLSEHDRIPTSCKCSNPRITFDGLNWWISIGVECSEITEQPTNECVGIDIGIKDLAVCSDQKIRKVKTTIKQVVLYKLEKYMKQFAIFDLDGTVINSMWIWKTADIDFLSKYNVVPSDEMREKIQTLGLTAIAKTFIDEYSLNLTVDEVIKQICDVVEKRYLNEVTPKEDIEEFLEYLFKNNVKMCIATACDRTLAVNTLDRLGLLKYFNFVLTCEELSTTKKEPFIYYEAARRLGATVENTTVYEDALHAVLTAKNGGFEVVAIFDEYEQQKKHLISDIADLFIYKYCELTQ